MGWSNLKEAVPPLYTQHIAECFFEWDAAGRPEYDEDEWIRS